MQIEEIQVSMRVSVLRMYVCEHICMHADENIELLTYYKSIKLILGWNKYATNLGQDICNSQLHKA